MSNPSRLSTLTDSFYSKLSLRERVAVVVFVLMFMGMLSYFVFDRWVKAQEITLSQIKTLREEISAVKAGEARFREVLAQRKAYKKLLENNKIDLAKVMERYTKGTGITINDFKDKRQVLSDSFDQKSKGDQGKVVVAYTQEVSINTAQLKELSTFLERLERERSPVRITSLSLRTSSQDRQELRFIKLGVTTYKSEVDQ